VLFSLSSNLLSESEILPSLNGDKDGVIDVTRIAHSISRLKGFWEDVLTYKGLDGKVGRVFEENHAQRQLLHLLGEYAEHCQAIYDKNTPLIAEELADVVIVASDLCFSMGVNYQTNFSYGFYHNKGVMLLVADMGQALRKTGTFNPLVLVDIIQTCIAIAQTNEIDLKSAFIAKCEKNLKRTYRYGVV